MAAATARRMHDWDIAAAHMSLQANIHRDTKKRRQPFAPADFNPLRRPEKAVPQGDISCLKVFLRGNVKRAAPGRQEGQK